MLECSVDHPLKAQNLNCFSFVQTDFNISFGLNEISDRGKKSLYYEKNVVSASSFFIVRVFEIGNSLRAVAVITISIQC